MEKLGSWSSVEGALNTLAIERARIAKETAVLEAKIGMLREKYDNSVKTHVARADELYGMLESFAISHKGEFMTERKRSFTSGEIGFRTGNPKVARINGKLKWEDVIERIERELGVGYISVKKDAAKSVILRDYASGELSSQALAGAGLRVEQEEFVVIETYQEKASGI